jgi:hypothetical protein
MGTLKPGATYIYERSGGTVYAREFGSTERKVIGYEWPNKADPLQYDLVETQLWQDIVHAGKTNPTLQKALDRAKMLYNMSEEYERKDRT